jgi:hypothetical protein
MDSLQRAGNNEDMRIRVGQSQRLAPIALGLLTLAGVAALFLRDAVPQWFGAKSHDALAAFSLAMIAVAYLAYQLARRAAAWEMAKAVLLAAAFWFWAANQYWPNFRQAMLLNDIAVGLFVLDVFLVIAGLPQTAGDASK